MVAEASCFHEHTHMKINAIARSYLTVLAYFLQAGLNHHIRGMITNNPPIKKIVTGRLIYSHPYGYYAIPCVTDSEGASTCLGRIKWISKDPELLSMMVIAIASKLIGQPVLK